MAKKAIFISLRLELNVFDWECANRKTWLQHIF